MPVIDRWWIASEEEEVRSWWDGWPAWKRRRSGVDRIFLAWLGEGLIPSALDGSRPPSPWTRSNPTGQWTRRWWWSLRRISDDSFLPSTIYHSRGPTIMTNRSSGSFPPALENGVIHWSISRVFCWRIDVTTCLFVYAYTYQLKYKFLILNLNWFWEVFIEVYFSVLFLDR